MRQREPDDWYSGRAARARAWQCSLDCTALRLLNHVLSANVDVLVAKGGAGGCDVWPGHAEILDICCGRDLTWLY